LVRADANTPWFGNWRNRLMPHNFGARLVTRVLGSNDWPKIPGLWNASISPPRICRSSWLSPRKNNCDLTVVGPDNPLALGIVDLFQRNGLRIWGPNQGAAQFEASKVFSQRFMEKYGIPTARAGTFSDPANAKRFAVSLAGKCAVKADGLALGKGVLICANEGEANRAIDEIW